MKIGIVGYAGCGKTTVFNVLSGQRAEVGGYTGKGSVRLGTIKVPDARVDAMSELYQPKKTTFAEILFADLVAPSPSVSGQSFDAETLGHVRQMGTLVHVLRAFLNPALDEDADPLRDFRNLEAELGLADLEVLEKRIARLDKEGGKARELPLLRRLVAHLEDEKPLRTATLTADELQEIKGFAFLSLKPLLVLVNQSEDEAGAEPNPDLAAAVTATGGQLGSLCGQLEAEIADLDVEDRAVFLADLGLELAARDRFIRDAYAALDLISFLTVGPDEVRAWSVPRGTTAVRAAGAIHSDLERGFIRAEVIPYAELAQLGSEAKCREAGKLRVEGKEYKVQDGDVLHVRFNV